MSDEREQVAQQKPRADVDLHRFPTRALRAGVVWWRQHQAAMGAWWFSSTGTGRFDLSAPRGTCYLADSAPAAVRERLGPDLVAHAVVPASLLAGRVISRLPLPHPVRAANLDAAATVRFGVSRELPVMVPYAVPQAWALALADAGFDAVVAGLRFTPGRPVGLALFGDAGLRSDWRADPDPVVASAVAERIGIVLVAEPELRQLRVVQPPRQSP